MKKNIEFICNNELVSAEINPALTALDFIRGEKKLTGTKEGCREGDCGACTVLIGTLKGNSVNYISTNSCLFPMERLRGKHLVTIEGLNKKLPTLIQSEMIKEGGTQCGFCTSGFIVSIANYFLSRSEYTFDDAVSFLDGNICRCTGYEGIKRAIKNVIAHISSNSSEEKNKIKSLVDSDLLPEYFLTIPKHLKNINHDTSSMRKKKKTVGFIISGGTDLYVQKWEEVYSGENDFIPNEKIFNEIRFDKNKLIIGGGVTIEEFRISKHIEKFFPQLKEYLKMFGSLPIRNRATIAGNIINASPIADMSNIFLALGASIELSNGKKTETLPLKDFFLGYKILNKQPNDLLTAVTISIPKGNYFFSYEKVSRRKYLDIASVNTSILIEEEYNKIISTKISAGGVAPIPLFLENTSNFLKNKNIESEVVKSASEILLKEISPISDARGSREYKSTLLKHLFFSHFINLFPDNIFVEELI